MIHTENYHAWCIPTLHAHRYMYMHSIYNSRGRNLYFQDPLSQNIPVVSAVHSVYHPTLYTHPLLLCLPHRLPRGRNQLLEWTQQHLTVLQRKWHQNLTRQHRFRNQSSTIVLTKLITSHFDVAVPLIEHAYNSEQLRYTHTIVIFYEYVCYCKFRNDICIVNTRQGNLIKFNIFKNRCKIIIQCSILISAASCLFTLNVYCCFSRNIVLTNWISYRDKRTIRDLIAKYSIKKALRSFSQNLTSVLYLHKYISCKIFTCSISRYS